eukprot:750020-Hanusia_phi.AAC.1
MLACLAQLRIVVDTEDSEREYSSSDGDGRAIGVKVLCEDVRRRGEGEGEGERGGGTGGAGGERRRWGGGGERRRWRGTGGGGERSQVEDLGQLSPLVLQIMPRRDVDDLRRDSEILVKQDRRLHRPDPLQQNFSPPPRPPRPSPPRPLPALLSFSCSNPSDFISSCTTSCSCLLVFLLFFFPFLRHLLSYHPPFFSNLSLFLLRLALPFASSPSCLLRADEMIRLISHPNEHLLDFLVGLGGKH